MKPHDKGKLLVISGPSGAGKSTVIGKLMELRDRDLNETVPQLLSNAMYVMKSSGIFDSEERKRIWVESCSLIGRFTAIRFS